MLSGPGPDPGPLEYVALSVLSAVFAAGALRTCRWAVGVSETRVVVIGLFSERSLAWWEITHCVTDDGGMHIYSDHGDVLTERYFGRPKWRDMGIKRLATGETSPGTSWNGPRNPRADRSGSRCGLGRVSP